MSTDPWTPGQLADAGRQVSAPPVGTGPAADEMAAKVPAASATSVDVESMLASLQAQIQELKASQRQSPEGTHPLVATATAARGLIAEHFDRGYRGDSAAILRLADDLVDASANAVSSGDAGPARQVARKLEVELNRVHPGPGDHHYFKNALALVGYHFPIAADAVTSAQPSNAPALSGGAPAKVVAGSVTG